MNKCKLISYCFLLFCSITMAQVGMPTSEPKGALDLNTTTNTNTYGLVLPTTDNPKQKIRNPNDNNNLTRVEGTMIYDSRQDCVRIFQKGNWSNCLCTKGDEGCLDYFPGQGGVLPWVVLNEHSFGFSKASIDIQNYSQVLLEQTSLFGENGIYKKYKNLHVGRSFYGNKAWEDRNAGQHPNYLGEGDSFNGHSYDGFGIASLDAEGVTSTPFKSERVEATKAFIDAGNVIFITLTGSPGALNANPVLQYYNFPKTVGEYLDANAFILPTEASKGPFKYGDNDELEPIPISDQRTLALINVNSLPANAVVYATRTVNSGINKGTYAAVFSIGKMFFFDATKIHDGKHIFNLGANSNTAKNKRHKNFIYNIVTKALDMMDVDKVYTPNPL